MCFREFIGYSCGHTTLAVFRPCPMTTSLHTNPTCPKPAIRQFNASTTCPACARTLHGRWVNIVEEEHRWMHDRGVCSCPVMFPALQHPRVIQAPGNRGETDRSRESSLEESTTQVDAPTKTTSPDTASISDRASDSGTVATEGTTKGSFSQTNLGAGLSSSAIKAGDRRKGAVASSSSNPSTGHIESLNSQTEAHIAPLYKEVGDNRTEGWQVSLRLPSIYAVEWNIDHAELHKAGKCNCRVDFKKYRPKKFFQTETTSLPPVQQPFIPSQDQERGGGRGAKPQRGGGQSYRGSSNITYQRGGRGGGRGRGRYQKGQHQYQHQSQQDNQQSWPTNFNLPAYPVPHTPMTYGVDPNKANSTFASSSPYYTPNKDNNSRGYHYPTYLEAPTSFNQSNNWWNENTQSSQQYHHSYNTGHQQLNYGHRMDYDSGHQSRGGSPSRTATWENSNSPKDDQRYFSNAGDYSPSPYLPAAATSGQPIYQNETSVVTYSSATYDDNPPRPRPSQSSSPRGEEEEQEERQEGETGERTMNPSGQKQTQSSLAESQLPLPGFPIGAGPEGGPQFSHAGPFGSRTCDLFASPPQQDHQEGEAKEEKEEVDPESLYPPLKGRLGRSKSFG